MESRELNSALIGQELHDGWTAGICKSTWNFPLTRSKADPKLDIDR